MVNLDVLNHPMLEEDVRRVLQRFAHRAPHGHLAGPVAAYLARLELAERYDETVTSTTRRQYQSIWNTFVRWCKREGFHVNYLEDEGILTAPVPAEVVRAYLRDRVGTCRSTSLAAYLSAIRFFHYRVGFPVPDVRVADLDAKVIRLTPFLSTPPPAQA